MQYLKVSKISSLGGSKINLLSPHPIPFPIPAILVRNMMNKVTKEIATIAAEIKYDLKNFVKFHFFEWSRPM
jgi:hypothetical protein